MELKSEKRIYASINLRLKKLGQLGPLLQGTPVRKYRKCTAADCPCHRGRKMHPFLVISTKVDQKTRTLYVPVAMEETALAWVKNFRSAKKLIAELKKTNPQVESNIFSSMENVNLDTVLGCQRHGVRHDFAELYGE